MELKPSVYDISRGIKLPNEISEDLAYIIGVLAGDGHISKEGYDIHCAGNRVDEVEYYDTIIRDLFIKLFNWELKMKFFSDGTYGFRSGSKLIQTYLIITFGIPKGNKYEHLQIPQIIKNNEKFLLAYLQGIADTDFGFSLKKNRVGCICGSSKSSKFMKEIATELKKQGIRFYEVYDRKSFDPRFKQGFSLISRIEIFSIKDINLWIRIIGFRNPKHLNKVDMWLKKYKN